MKPSLFILFFFCLALPASAAELSPLLYTRSEISIERAHPPALPPLPWQTGAPGYEPPAIRFDVEVRDAAAFYNQKGWFNLSPLSPGQGILLAFGAPILAPISPASHYSPLDILMIDKEGRIVYIAPKLLLSELSEDIYPKSPILALLLLSGGACEKQSIAPGDFVDYKIFKNPPAVLGEPAPAPSTN